MKITHSDDIRQLLQQRTPLIALESTQENYVLELLGDIVRDLNQTLYRWTLTEGLESISFGPSIAKTNGDVHSPVEALKEIKARNQGGVFVLCDFHPHWQDPLAIRLLKDIILGYNVIEKHIVLLSYRLEVPPDLKPYTTFAKLTLPSEEEILNIIKTEAQRYVNRSNAKRQTIPERV